MNAVPPKHTILVVDDEKAYCAAAAEILRTSGYVVLQANSAGEARTILAGTQVDAVLLDVMMPDVDGLTVLRELSASPRFLHVPLVIVSAKTTAADRSEAFRMGADAYLAKPYTLEELLDVMDFVLHKADHQGTAPLEETRINRARLAALRRETQD